MDKKLEALIPELEELLSQEKYSAFYIGKTNNCDSRRDEHKAEKLTPFWELAYGESEAINQGEIDLIYYFKEKSPLKGKCLNENKGGAGNPEATYLYVVMEPNNKTQLTTEDLYDDIVNPFEPLIEL